MLKSAGAWFSDLSGPARAGLWMTASAFCYAASATIARHLSDDLPTFQIVLLRNLFGLVFMAPWLMRVGVGALRTQRLGTHVVRGMFSAINLWCLFGALAYIPVADMSAINFLQPIFGSIIAIVALHEAASGRRWAAVFVGFIGAMIIIRPGFQQMNVGVLLALGSALAGAIVAIIIKYLVRTELPDTVAVYLFIVQTALSVIPGLLVWRPLTLEQVFWLAVLGYVAVLLQRTFNRGMVAADATVALPFNFTRLIWAALLGYAVFAELPDIWTWIGGALIFAASIYLSRRGAAP